MTDQGFDVSDTLIPNTDQLVADDLRTGHRDIKITKVERIADEKRPLAISFEGDGGKPYLPNVSMRRVIAEAWGTDRRQWVGKWLRLFRNPSVKMGKTEVGGIRISHAYPLSQPELLISLITTKGKRSLYRLARMEPPNGQPARTVAAPATPPTAAATPEPPETTQESAAEADSRLQATLSAIAKLPADMLQNTLALAHTKLDAGEITPQSFAAIKAAITSRSNQLK